MACKMTKKHMIVLLFFVFTICQVMNVRAASPLMKITAFDWGTSAIASGDAVLVQSGSSYLLMDTQQKSANNQVISYLKSHKIRKLDLYLSHWHSDHYAYMETILRDPYFTVKKLYIPPYQWVRDHYPSKAREVRSILSAAKKKKVKIIYLRKGLTFSIGKAKAQVLWYHSSHSDVSQYWSYGNSHSVLTRITAGGISFLTGGDLEQDTEKEILAAKINVRADIFKLSHHGTGDSMAFLKAVSPTYTFYMSSSERKNRIDVSHNDGRTFANRISSLFSVRRNGNITFTVYPKGAKTRIVVSAQRNIRQKKVKGKVLYVRK